MTVFDVLLFGLAAIGTACLLSTGFFLTLVCVARRVDVYPTQSHPIEFKGGRFDGAFWQLGEREPEYIGARQLKYAENVGKLSRILSTQGPQTVADLALKTGFSPEWVYKALKKEYDLFAEDSPSGSRGTTMRWRWVPQWKHES